MMNPTKNGASAFNKGSSSLKVVHKYGPCNRHKKSIPPPSFTEILRRDKLRVDSIIQARRSMNLVGNVERLKRSTVPFHGLSKTSASDYVLNVGLGTPKKEFPLVFDTGSGLIWTQCKPCKPCSRKAPVFDPTKSTSFKGIPCSSKQCQGIEQEGNNKYAPLRVHDRLSGDLGEENSGIFGLNREPISFPSQTADKYNKLFSYCIPSTPGSTGYLTFGSKVSKDVKFSHVSKRAPSSDYDIEMTGISVGGRKILIDATVFKIRCTIDSGAVYSYLPPKAYSVLRSVFGEMMKSYPMVDVDDSLDTCYNFRNYKTVTIPAVSVFFKGEVQVDIDVSGIMVRVDEYKVYCLAFAALDEEYAILGNTQQRTHRVFFDGAKERIGFAPGGCD
ncbi:unnamed protein product [Dovyalis caffra]|uniref:Peptidase A1 domain-containing protein n=1 Tax=Dovyalis caffra TaxID=77055 RepID=A0AAV1SLC6_9ROSI|nr:unnamed protein product [Dovyalis caffra]